MRKLVYGVGINDADYAITENIVVDGKNIQMWICPFYRRWKSMLGRCYGQKPLSKNPSYNGCYVLPQWHYFMTFRSWMEKQDWQGKELDKDLLVPGNKIYGPESCVFISQGLNKFLTEVKPSISRYPVGVTFKKRLNKFQAQCHDIIQDKNQYLGLYETAQEAHQAWLSFKLEQAKILAGQQSDPRVAEALISRYKNYQSLDREANLAYNG